MESEWLPIIYYLRVPLMKPGQISVYKMSLKEFGTVIDKGSLKNTNH